MNINVTKDDFEVLEREYENAILGNMEDDEDLFVPMPDVGLCRVRKGSCRSIIDEARRQFNSGKRYVRISINPY